MKGDFTRSTFRRTRRYDGVRMQQGRVQLDADWNEQVDILAYLRHTTAVDVIGRCGVPRHHAGFRIESTFDGAVGPVESGPYLTINPGRIYVDGILCELFGDPVPVLEFLDDHTIQLEALILDGRPLAADQWLELLADSLALTPGDDEGEPPVGSPPEVDLERLADDARRYLPSITGRLRGVEERRSLIEGLDTGVFTRLPELLKRMAEHIQATLESGGFSTAINTRLQDVLNAVETFPSSALDSLNEFVTGPLATDSAPLADMITVLEEIAAGTRPINDLLDLLPQASERVTLLVERYQQLSPLAAAVREGIEAIREALETLMRDVTALSDAQRRRVLATLVPLNDNDSELEDLADRLRDIDAAGRDNVDQLWTVYDRLLDMAGWLPESFLPPVAEPPTDETPSPGDESPGSGPFQRLRIQSVDPVGKTVAFYQPVASELLALVETDPNGPRPMARRLLTYDTQPDYPLAPPAQADGTYLAYLDVWQRHVTALEDPFILEVALGGPDTTTRTQMLWQVKLYELAEDEEANCEAFANWQSVESTGRLRARSQPGVIDDDDPCTIPADAGYRRLENQLYRVEIHNPGDASQATFKWSRENGSVARHWSDQGGVLLLDKEPPDRIHGFAQSDWVEVTDDGLELMGLPGIMVQLGPVEGREFTFQTGTAVVPPELVDLGLSLASFPRPDYRAKLRRWESKSAPPVLADAMLAETDGWVRLEDGVQVQFDADGTYQTGDYWLIPARTNLGDVIWPVDDDDTTPLFEDRHGVTHHYCPLAFVTFDPEAMDFALVEGAADCRCEFPPLTEIESGESACTIVVGPEDDLQAAITALAEGEDASICFKVGDYFLQSPVRIAGKGHLKLTGAGPGTHLIAAGSESAIVFENCASVRVRDLYAESGKAGSGESINGALTFLNCPLVTVEHVMLKCPPYSRRAASCLTIRNDDPQDPTFSVARVQHCDLTVGMLQVGLQIINVDRAIVEDNVIRAVEQTLSWEQLVQDDMFLADKASYLLSSAVGDNDTSPRTTASIEARVRADDNLTDSIQDGEYIVADAETNMIWYVNPQAWRNVTVTVRSTTVHFHSIIDDSSFWQALANLLIDPASIRNEFDLIEAMEDIVRLILTDPGRIMEAASASSGRASRGRIPNPLAGNNPTDVYEQLRRSIRPYFSRGIVIAGSVANDIRVHHNTIAGAQQGVRIALSHEGQARLSPDRIGRAHVSDNTLVVVVPIAMDQERFGIFVGNCDSLLVENNRIYVDNLMHRTTPIDGILLFGYYGRMVSVHKNHVEGATVGVYFNPLGDMARQPVYEMNRSPMMHGNLMVDADYAASAAEASLATPDIAVMLSLGNFSQLPAARGKGEELLTLPVLWTIAYTMAADAEFEILGRTLVARTRYAVEIGERLDGIEDEGERQERIARNQGKALLVQPKWFNWVHRIP